MIDESTEFVSPREALPAASEPAAAAFSWVFVVSLLAHAAIAARLVTHHPAPSHATFASQVEVELARPPEPPPPPPPPEEPSPAPEPVVAAAPPPLPKAAPAPAAQTKAPSVDPTPALAAPGPPSEEGTFAAAATAGNTPAVGVANGVPGGTGVAPPPPPPPPPAPVVPAREGANYRNNPRPPYPRHALKEGWEGKTLLKVKVLPDGRVGGAVVQQSAGHSILDDAAVAAVKGWTFTPAKQGETPVEGWVTVPIEFHIQ